MRTLNVQIVYDEGKYEACVDCDGVRKWKGSLETQGDWRKLLLEMIQASWRRPEGDAK